MPPISTNIPALYGKTMQATSREDTLSNFTTTLSYYDTYFSNENTTDNSIHIYKVEQLTFLSILLVFIVIGNCTVLKAVLPTRIKGSSRMNFFIMHLAITDLANGLLCVLTDIIWITIVSFNAGNVMCKIVKFLQEVAVFASTYVLVSLSLDRLDAIARPLRFTDSGTRAKMLVAMAWAFSILFSIPSLVLFNERMLDGDIIRCWMNLPEKWHWKLYVTLLALVLLIIPVLIIICCYTAIIYIIWKHSHLLAPSKSISSRRKNKGGVSSMDSSRQRTANLSERAEAGSSSSRGVIPQAKIRTIKMTFLIVLTFILCWSPYFIFNLLQVYGHIKMSSQTAKGVTTFFQSLAPLNSAANPIIYGIFSTRVCKKLRKVDTVDEMAKKMCCCAYGRTANAFTTLPSDYTIMSEMDLSQGTSAIVRRPSGVLFVKNTITEKEREVLLRNLKPAEPADFHEEAFGSETNAFI